MKRKGKMSVNLRMGKGKIDWMEDEGKMPDERETFYPKNIKNDMRKSKMKGACM